MAKVIRNTKQLEAAMDKLMRKALDRTSEEVELLISHFLQLWYDDYSPHKYKRTYQFLKSCTRTKVAKRGDRYESRIYINYKKMHHILYVGSEYSRPFKPSEEYNIVQYANFGIHGIGHGVPGDTQLKFWDDALKEMNNTDYIVNCFYDYLKSLGFDVEFNQEGTVSF